MTNLWKIAEDIAKQLSPQDKKMLRKLYSDQKARDSSLDETVEDLTQEIQDGFKHIVTPDE